MKHASMYKILSNRASITKIFLVEFAKGLLDIKKLNAVIENETNRRSN